MIEIAIARAGRLIEGHEGCELKVYDCPAGYKTIGIGRNLEGKGITREEARYLLRNDLRECVRDLAKFPYFERLTANRKAALIDMRFNLGPSRFRAFKKMHAALSKREYGKAAAEMLDSRWAVQVGRRAKRLAQIIETGESPSE